MRLYVNNQIGSGGLREWLRQPDVVDVGVATAYLVGIAATATFFTGDVLAAAWANEGVLFAAFSLLAEVLGGPVRAQLSVFGFALGLSLVWAFDTYKRYQTFAPVTLLVAGAYAAGALRPAVIAEVTVGTASLGVVAAVAGAQAGGLPLVQRLVGRAKRLRGVPPVSFRRAPTLLFAGVVATVLVGLADLHLALGTGSPGLTAVNDVPVHGATGLVLALLFYKFTQYDSDVKIVQLGPARSGKTSMIGGLAGDVDREAREGDGDGSLDEIRSRLEDERRFPSLTDDVTYHEFRYMSNRPVFRKRHTISTLDYPGEKLTGQGSEEPLSDRIINYRQRQEPSLLGRLTTAAKRFVPLDEREDSWDEGVRDLEEDAAHEMMALAKLVDAADIVVFTLPLDDFLGRVIERGNTPAYLDSVKLIEPTDVDGEFVVRTPDGGADRVHREDGELRYADTGEPYPDPWGELEDLPRTPDGNYYYVARDRSGRDEYKEEYKDLIRILNDDRRKSFVWTTTMSDLVNEDFLSVYEDAAELVERPDDHGGALAEHVERARDVGLFDTTPTEFLRHDRQGRKVHARWIQKEYVENAFPEFDQMLSDTFEEFVYPVWFEIDEDRTATETPGIEIKNGTILQGSDLVLDRFENRRLLEHASLTGGDDSAIQSGYRVMYAAAQAAEEAGVEPDAGSGDASDGERGDASTGEPRDASTGEPRDASAPERDGASDRDPDGAAVDVE